MNNLFSSIEMAVIIILPLILFFQKLNMKGLLISRNVISLYLIWFSTYALIHELSHLFGTWLTNARVIDYQLIPNFWEGDFKTGYINTEYSSSFQEFVVVILPYLKNVILLIVGYILIEKNIIHSSFMVGLIVVMLVLSPLYDVFNNYFAFVLGSLNDFNAIGNFTGKLGSHLIGTLLTFFSILINIFVLIIIRKQYYFNYI